MSRFLFGLFWIYRFNISYKSYQAPPQIGSQVQVVLEGWLCGVRACEKSLEFEFKIFHPKTIPLAISFLGHDLIKHKSQYLSIFLTCHKKLFSKNIYTFWQTIFRCKNCIGIEETTTRALPFSVTPSLTTSARSIPTWSKVTATRTRTWSEVFLKPGQKWPPSTPVAAPLTADHTGSPHATSEMEKSKQNISRHKIE